MESTDLQPEAGALEGTGLLGVGLFLRSGLDPESRVAGNLGFCICAKATQGESDTPPLQVPFPIHAGKAHAVVFGDIVLKG